MLCIPRCGKCAQAARARRCGFPGDQCAVSYYPRTGLAPEDAGLGLELPRLRCCCLTHIRDMSTGALSVQDKQVLTLPVALPD